MSLLIKTKWCICYTCTGLQNNGGTYCHCSGIYTHWGFSMYSCHVLGRLYYSPVTRKLQNSMCLHGLEMSINLSVNEKGEGFSSLQMNWNRCNVSPRSLIKTTQDLYLFYMEKSFTRVWKLYGNIAFKNLTIESSFISALYHFMNGTRARAFLIFGLIYWFYIPHTNVANLSGIY